MKRQTRSVRDLNAWLDWRAWRHPSSAAMLLLLAAVVLGAQPAEAGWAKIFWLASASPDGEWSEEGNWLAQDEPYPPVPTDVFQVRISGGYTANLNSAGAVAASVIVGKNQGQFADDSGTLNITGGDLTVQADPAYPYIWPSMFIVGQIRDGWVNQTGGDVYVEGYSVNQWGLLIGGSGDNSDPTVGNGTYAISGGSLVVNRRTMIGYEDNLGRLTVAGDSTAITALSTNVLNLYPTGTLEFVIGPGGVKALDVAVDAHLSGALEVKLTEGFIPTVGESFTLVDAGGLDGFFGNVTGLDIAPGLAFDLVYDEVLHDVRLEVVATPLPGDFDGSGVVDTQDINAFVLALTDAAAYEATYGEGALTYDTNADGLINTEDINPFVAILTGAGQASVIPEPASLSLLVVMGGLVLARRR